MNVNESANTNATEDSANIDAIVKVLLSHGDMFYGNDSAEAAIEWDSYGFSARGVDLWCSANVWDPRVANALHDNGLSVQSLRNTVQSMIETNGADAYTNGCPIYAACNSDISVQQIIDAYRNLRS